jgi:hypothetical protein
MITWTLLSILEAEAKKMNAEMFTIKAGERPPSAKFSLITYRDAVLNIESTKTAEEYFI